jgi:hypothetical protein
MGERCGLAGLRGSPNARLSEFPRVLSAGKPAAEAKDSGQHY